VRVKADFSDLGEKMNYYSLHLHEAERIANNSVTLFRDRFLTPAAQACYWRKQFETWSVKSFKPDFYRTSEGKSWRGIPFEEYM